MLNKNVKINEDNNNLNNVYFKISRNIIKYNNKLSFIKKKVI